MSDVGARPPLARRELAVQIYPEDRGTNYAVREGEQAAQAVLCALAQM